MKRILLLILLFALIRPVDGQNHSNVSLKDHLISLNCHWQDQDLKVPPSDAFSSSEKALIQMHLSLVEKKLRAKKTDHLTLAQQNNREQCLDHLHQYWNRGRFPINLYHPERTPYFIDDFGTACAVGHLLLSTNNDEMVDRIKKDNNYAYIKDLDRQYPELGQWAQTNGFEVEELAWIQPCYCFDPIPLGSVTHVSCYGGYDGQFNPAIDPSWTAPFEIYHYYWSATLSEWDLLGCGGCDLVAGDYKGEVIDGDGLVHESFVTILQPDSLYATISTTNDDGNCNGVASIDVFGGNGFATIQWESTTDEGSSYVENLCAGTYPLTITDGGDCFYTFYDTVQIQLATSTENELTPQLKVFPNPTADRFFVQFEEEQAMEAQLTIFNLSGAELVSETTFTQQLEVDLSHFDAGIYLVAIERGDQRRVEKIIKNN
ncbi:MAG: T9SS type A sorting domain-containing protein [Bacteroidota bacterium]